MTEDAAKLQYMSYAGHLHLYGAELFHVRWLHDASPAQAAGGGQQALGHEEAGDQVIMAIVGSGIEFRFEDRLFRKKPILHVPYSHLLNWALLTKEGQQHVLTRYPPFRPLRRAC